MSQCHLKLRRLAMRVCHVGLQVCKLLLVLLLLVVLLLQVLLLLLILYKLKLVVSSGTAACKGMIEVISCLYWDELTELGKQNCCVQMQL